MDDIAWTTDFLQRSNPRPFSAKPLTLASSLMADEAHWFRKAIETGIIRVGPCRSDCPRLRRALQSGPDEFSTLLGQHRHLYSLPKTSRTAAAQFNREYIPHIAAVARAIIDFGFSRDRYVFSRHRTFRQDYITKKRGQSYETDAEFYAGWADLIDSLTQKFCGQQADQRDIQKTDANDQPDKIELQIGAKKDAAQLKKIATAIEQCGTLSGLPLDCQSELEYLLDLKPKRLWLVAPGSIDPSVYMYDVRVDGLQVEFQPVSCMSERAAPKQSRS